MAEVQQQEEKPNVIDISKFFGGKTLSSADIRVNKSQTLKTKPSFIAAPELASLLDVIATSVEDKNNTIERVKSVERIREREIVERSKSDATFQRALSGLRFDVDSISKSYASLIKSLETDRKNRETENRLAEDLKKQNTTRLSTERVGASLAKPTQTIAGGETQTEEPQQEEGFDVQKFLGAAAAAAGVGAAGMFGGDEDDGGGGGGTPGSGGKLQPIHKQALDIISGPESGGDYNAMNRGRAADSPGGSKKWIGKNLTEMTIGEVKALQRQNNPVRLHAAGRYQIVPVTLPSAQSAAGLKDNDMFDQNNQDLLAIGILKTQGPSAWSNYSKYSKKEIDIMYKAKATPLGISEGTTAEGQSKSNEGTTQSTSTSTSTPTSTGTPQASTGTPQAAGQQASTGTPQAAGQQAAAETPQAAAETSQEAAGTPSSSTVAAAPSTDTDPMEKSSANPPSVATASQKSQTPQQIAQEESSMKPASSTAVASAGITPSEITPTKTGSQSPPIIMSQSPPPRSSGGSYGDDEPVGSVPLFSSTNPDNLYVAYSLKELNIV